MSSNSSLEKLELLRNMFSREISETDLDIAISDLEGWDSIMMVRLMMNLEQQVGRELSEEEMVSMTSVRDVERLLNAS